MNFDFHTHNLNAKPGSAIINIPQEWMVNPALFHPVEGAFYSAGIHPWWTNDDQAVEVMKKNLQLLLQHPQVIAVGECGLDTMQGAPLAVQEEIFKYQITLAETYRLPVTLHAVRTFDRLLRLKKELRPTTQWTIHGFRGKPSLARQLLAAGFNLSFGIRRNEESFILTPPERRREETDEDYQVHVIAD